MAEQEPHSQRRAGRASAELQQGWLDVGDARRTFLLAPVPQPEAPLPIVLHGLGTSGKDMDTFTGLAHRGPAAEFATVFPDACDQMWDDGRQRGRHRATDDFGFMEALFHRLVSDRVAGPGALFLVGLSNGALFAERLARHGILPVTGIVLVAGTTSEPTRRAAPRPVRPAAVLCFEGTADPFMPYAGGSRQHSGLLARLVAWRAGWRPGDPPREGTVAVDTIARDWVEVNGLPLAPSVDSVPSADGDLPVTRISSSSPGRRPVVLYRVEGGGHTWPGGPQQMPARLIGPVARHLDATGILLEMARQEILSGSSGGS